MAWLRRDPVPPSGTRLPRPGVYRTGGKSMPSRTGDVPAARRGTSSIFPPASRARPWRYTKPGLTDEVVAGPRSVLLESIVRREAARVLVGLLMAVVGLFESAIAQALAVTMRGLALREIGTSHWRRVARKELGAGMLNGVAVALTTALGVWVWSGSFGLASVIALSMVIAMTAAGVAGVVVPMVLSALGQDPAQSSSIILSTITDITGFFSFFGIATLLSGFL